MLDNLIRFLLLVRQARARIGLRRDARWTGPTIYSTPAARFFIRQLTRVQFLVCCLVLAGCGGVVVPQNANTSLSVNSQNISFGDVELNSSSTQSIILTCSGSAPVTITGSKISGAGFIISGLAVPDTLEPGQSVTLNVQFLPTTAGTVTGQLTLTTNSLTDPTVLISLAGAGENQAQNQPYHVSLTWNAPIESNDPIAGFEVYRSSSGNTQYQLLTPSIDAQPNFMDSNVQSGMTYQYYVTTVDSLGVQSVPSNQAEVTIP